MMPFWKKQRLRPTLPGLTFSVLETLLLFPAVLAVAVQVRSDVSIDWIAWIALCLLAGAGGWILSFAGRYIQEAFLALFIVGAVWVPLQIVPGALAFIAALIPLFLLTRGWSRASDTSGDTVHYFMVGFGFFLYFVIYVMLARSDLYEPYAVWLTIPGILAVAISLWTQNWVWLKRESGSGGRAALLSKAMVRQNRMILAILLVLILLVASIRPIADAVMAVLRWIVAGIRALLAMLPKTSETTEEAPAGSDMPELPPPTETSDGWLQQVIDWILTIGGIVICAVMVAFVLYQITRVLKILVKRLLAYYRSGRQTKPDSFGYTDEKESLLEEDWKGLRGKLKEWLDRRGARSERWDQLASNRERVRFLYRSWHRRRSEAEGQLPVSATPRELLSGEGMPRFAELYEQARYGEQALEGAEEELARLKDALDRKGGKT